MNRVCEGIDTAVEDTSIVLALVSDDNVFFETKKEYGKDMVTGFIRLNGMTIGAVKIALKIYDEEGNAVQEFGGTLSVRGCKKAADFVNCCADYPSLLLAMRTGTIPSLPMHLQHLICLHGLAPRQSLAP